MKAQRDQSGILFRNDKKTQDSHPDYKGRARIKGVDYWLSAWIKEGERGKFMSLSFQPAEEERPKRALPEVSGGVGEMDDDIPFAPRGFRGASYVE